MESLNKHQHDAVQIVLTSVKSNNLEPLLLLGMAGRGKTTIVDYLMSVLPPGTMKCTGTTGCAAAAFCGTTIHSEIGLKWSKNNKEENFNPSEEKKKEYSKLKVLVIDEISMLDRNHWGQIDMALRALRNN